MLHKWNPDRLQPVAALFMRVVVGLVFLSHGYPKLAHSEEWARAFAHMGFPGYFAYLAGTIEICGGALLLMGLATRPDSLLLAGEMLVALLRVDLPSGSVTQVDNYQLSLLLAVSAFVLAAFGPGPLSIDRIMLRTFGRADRTCCTRR